MTRPGFAGTVLIDEIMEVEKKRSKGGFLHLFDWNGKSRKKLFANNSESDEKTKKGKENVGNMTKSLLHVIEADESRASSSNKGSSSDINCASSVTSDESHGTKAPGVVARLMGLDSLPTSSVSEPNSTPYFDFCSHGASRYERNLCSENHQFDYYNIPNKEWFSSKHVEPNSRVRKVPNRPIERFQSESLPPKSAKSIPITHHKLLSPIKSPGFIPTRNTAYIVEAAAKIIEASPRDPAKDRRPSIASSVPLRIWDLREKLEAADRASRPHKLRAPVSTRNIRGQRNEQRNGEIDNKAIVRASMNVDKRSYENVRKKGKSVSLAEQAKSNVQRREGSTSSTTNRISMKQKEKSDVKTSRVHSSQPDTQRSVQKRNSLNRCNNALKLNNQKQNHASNNKESSTLKNSVFRQQGEKAKSMRDSVRPNRSSNKVVGNDKGKQVSSSKPKSLSPTKQFINEDSQSEKSVVSDNGLVKKEERRSIKCNVAIDGSVNWGVADRSRGADVVSFTFSSPIRSSKCDTQSSDQVIDVNNLQLYENSTFASSGVNAIGGDALSVLLEQKLRELTSKVESSHCNVIKDGTTDIYSFQDSVAMLGEVSGKCAVDDKGFGFYRDKDISGSQDNSCCTSASSPGFRVSQKWKFQQCEETGKHGSSSKNGEIELEFDHQDSNLSLSLEPSLTSIGCSESGNSIAEPQLFPFTQDQLPLSSASTNLSPPTEVETELLDSASSILVGDLRINHVITKSGLLDINESSDWELDYVREILKNADLMIHEFALDQTIDVISPSLFNRLENLENGTERNEEEFSKLRRKVLFDCVCESLDFKCQQLFVGSGNKVWAKRMTIFQRKDRLAEELYKEIMSWKSMEELMVDEVIDKDMSSKYGKWVDFEFEAFEEGLEIGNEILTCLVDELVSDFLIC